MGRERHHQHEQESPEPEQAGSQGLLLAVALHQLIDCLFDAGPQCFVNPLAALVGNAHISALEVCLRHFLRESAYAAQSEKPPDLTGLRTFTESSTSPVADENDSHIHTDRCLVSARLEAESLEDAADAGLARLGHWLRTPCPRR